MWTTGFWLQNTESEINMLESSSSTREHAVLCWSTPSAGSNSDISDPDDGDNGIKKALVHEFDPSAGYHRYCRYYYN